MPSIPKILTDINSWSDFFSYANSLKEKEKGDLFEYLTKVVLTTKPEYHSILNHVWLYNEIPSNIKEKLNLPPRDEGIDLIAETHDEKYWAIQCKFKGQNQAPTYKELSTFGQLANSYCRNISLALLVHTGERGVRKSHLLGEKYSEIGLEFWLGLASDDWQRIHRSIKHQSIRPQPRKPRPHQQKAIEGAVQHLVEEGATRGRMLMPCGTGKSLTAFWIANKLKARSIIVAVPSLALIKQSLEDWTKEFIAQNETPIPEWLVICSDESTAKLEKDEFVSNTYSLGIPTTTDVDEIESFLTREFKGRKIIFTTYQSSDKLAQAGRKSNFIFDLAILDEAHKTVGVKSKTFATLLLDKNITISQRVFMTATERIFRGDNDEILSMDDPGVYGDLFYQLTFKEAIHADPPIICDYKILTISVTSSEIEELITRNKLINIQPKQDNPQESQSLAAAIALRKAVQNYGIRHAISFHRSIKSADAFSDLHKRLNEKGVDDITLSSNHISSKKSAGQRAKIISDFVGESPALMTNARCLTEGVDVPAIDCVLFADPKQSIIDIVQASGRALRPLKGKDFGYIMLPLIVPDDTTFEEFTESTPFREVARIIAALSTQDELIAEEFRTIGSGSQPNGGKVVIDGSVPVGFKLDLKDFASEINAKIWEKVAKVNWRPFNEARTFVRYLHLKSGDEWRAYSKSGNKPRDIPVNPDIYYRGNGWSNWGDWLGTGNIAPALKPIRSFTEARNFVHKLGLRTSKEYKSYCESGEKPIDIPVNPARSYFNEGWINWGDWLGTNNVATALRKYLPFEEARDYVHKLNLRSGREWTIYRNSGNKPPEIPSNPNSVYSSNGWKGIGDWLGTGSVQPQQKTFLPFVEARRFVRALNLNDNDEWRKYCKSGLKPAEIPSAPDKNYCNKGWKNWGDWLGTGKVSNYHKEYLPFSEARLFIHTLGLKRWAEWDRYRRTPDKPAGIPTNPNIVYKGKGWIDFGDWLGSGRVANKKKTFLSFNDARSFVHSLHFENQNEWREYCRIGKKPDFIPSNPHRTYKDKGWISMGDWLGTGTIATSDRKFRPFIEARAYVRSLNLKSQHDWIGYYKSGKKPKDIPANPGRTYKNEGWAGFADWLGKEKT